MTARICQFRRRVDQGWNNLGEVGVVKLGAGVVEVGAGVVEAGVVEVGTECSINSNRPGEDIKLKITDIVVTGQVYGGFEGHGFQTTGNVVYLWDKQK